MHSLWVASILLLSLQISQATLFFETGYSGNNCQNSTLIYTRYELGECHASDDGEYVYFVCDGTSVTKYVCLDAACTDCDNYDMGYDNGCSSDFGGSSFQYCITDSSTLPDIQPTDDQVIEWHFSNSKCTVDPYEVYIYVDGVCLGNTFASIEVDCDDNNNSLDYWSCLGSTSNCQDSSSCFKMSAGNAECIPSDDNGVEVVCKGSWVYGGNASSLAASLGLIFMCLASLL